MTTEQRRYVVSSPIEIGIHNAEIGSRFPLLVAIYSHTHTHSAFCSVLLDVTYGRLLGTT